MCLSFQPQIPWVHASTTKTEHKIVQTLKTYIPDSGFRYTIFTDNPYSHISFKGPITDSQILIHHYVMFNPSSTKFTPLP